MRKVRISRFVAFEASGSEIVNERTDYGGYDRRLGSELARVGTRGGTIEVGRDGLLDLAEWCDALEIANSQSENYSGARALANLAEKCRALASELTNDE